MFPRLQLLLQRPFFWNGLDLFRHVRDRSGRIGLAGGKNDFTVHFASWHHLHKYEKRGKWTWCNARTKRSGQLWAASTILSGEIERWPIWPGPAGHQKERASLAGLLSHYVQTIHHCVTNIFLCLLTNEPPPSPVVIPATNDLTYTAVHCLRLCVSDGWKPPLKESATRRHFSSNTDFFGTASKLISFSDHF